MPTLREVRGDAGPLAVWEWPGGDPPALLLHGIGNYGRYWEAFAEAVGGRLRLIAPDARGHGDSAKPQGAAAGGPDPHVTEAYAPSAFVGDAIAVLDACGVERAGVIGHSMGGFHAAVLAATHPERVSWLVIVDAGPEVLPEGAARARRLSLERPDWFAGRAAAEAYLRQTSPGYPDSVYENRLRWLFREDSGRLHWRSSRDALARILAGSAERGSSWERARDIRAPTLLVRGTRSPVLSAEGARRLQRTIPAAELIELDAGHNVALDRPRELADAVAAFAARLARA